MEGHFTEMFRYWNVRERPFAATRDTRFHLNTLDLPTLARYLRHRLAVAGQLTRDLERQSTDGQLILA